MITEVKAFKHTNIVEKNYFTKSKNLKNYLFEKILRYCILKSNQVSWSVQIAKCIFFRRISIKDIKEEYEKIIIEKDNKINELITLIRELKKKNKTILKK